jgi:O-antigen/teichoic acid export membrane protein
MSAERTLDPVDARVETATGADRPWATRPAELPLFPTAEEVSGPLAERDHLDAVAELDGDHGHHAPGDPHEDAGQGRHVVRGSMWYIAAVATGAVFSFGYWVLAAHAASKDVYSIGTALWVDVQFVNFFTGMGLPVAVARYGALRQRSFHVLFLWALIYTSLASLVGALTFSAGAPIFVREDVTDALWQFGKPAAALIFFLLTAGMSFGLLVEVRLVTLRQWKWVYGRVIAISLVRLPFLLIPAIANNPLGLLMLIAGPMALSGFVGVIVLFVATAPADRGRLFPLPPQTMGAFKYANVNYVGMLAAQGPQFIIPVVVAWSVSGDFAPFFIAWSITAVIFLVPHTISQVVLAEGSRKSASRDQQLRHGLKLSLGLMCLATIATLVGAGVLPLVFPNGYELAVVLLPRFVAAGIPWAVTCMCLAKARVEGNHRRTVIITVGFALFTVIPTSLMSAKFGTDGAASAWLVGNIGAALLAWAVTRVQQGRKVDLVPSAARVDA